PFTPALSCRWACCREALTGEPWWIPADLVFLDAIHGGEDRLSPSLSTGLSCGRHGQPVLLRGLQEVIERDALVGCWWGRYPLEEDDAQEIVKRLGGELAARLVRPNLRYRCLRIGSPFSDHVTIVSLEGEDREGYCF